MLIKDWKKNKPWVTDNSLDLCDLKATETGLVWLTTRQNSSPKTILQGTVEGKRRRGRKSWMDNVREWTCCSFQTLLHRAEDCNHWRSLVAHAFTMTPIQPTSPWDEWVSEWFCTPVVMYDTLEIVCPARFARRELWSIAMQVEAHSAGFINIFWACYHSDLMVCGQTAQHHSHQGERLEQMQKIIQVFAEMHFNRPELKHRNAVLFVIHEQVERCFFVCLFV